MNKIDDAIGVCCT